MAKGKPKSSKKSARRGLEAEQEKRADSADSADTEWDVKRTTARNVAEPRTNSRKSDKEDEETDIQCLFRLVKDIDLFYDRSDVCFGSLSVNGPRETHALRGKSFSRLLDYLHHREKARPASSEAVSGVVRTLEARARYENEERGVFVRLGTFKGRVYVDLGTDEWNAVEIDGEGWRIVSDPPVRFRRPKGFGAFPVPVKGGTWNELRRLVNLDDDNWVLFSAVVVMSLRPRGPYPLAEIVGQHGSAKSTLSRILRNLVDPSYSAVRAEPQSLKDLMIAANNGWSICIDNISSLPTWLSDAFCRLSTGGGLSTRQLYSDDEETLFDLQRPVVLNGIEEVVVRGDLLSRTISIFLQAIPAHARKTEADVRGAFNAMQPRLLGVLFDAVSGAIRDKDKVVMPEKPRLADAAIWMTAAEPALGWARGTFLQVYERHLQRLRKRAVTRDVLGALLLEVADRTSFVGSATELLAVLQREAAPHLRRRLPATPASLGQKLRRLGADDLKACGVLLDVGLREGHDSNRIIRLEKVDSPVGAVGPVGNTEREQ